MKESMWGYLIVVLGIIIVVVIFLVSNLTTTNEQDYFLGREILKSSMYDAIDYGTYMKSGKLVMSKEKFVSIFTRRFAESVNPDRTFTLEFYDIIEYPPKATIRIATDTGEFNLKSGGVNVEINTFLTGILETSVSRGDYSVIFKTTTGDCTGDGNFSDDDIPEIEKYIKNGSGSCKDGSISILDRLDIDASGNVNEKDLILLKKYLYRGTPLDIDGDGEFLKSDLDKLEACAKVGKCNDTSVLTARQQVVADVNNDGTVDKTDLKLLERCLKEKKCNYEDINNDGKINEVDVTLIDACLNAGICVSNVDDVKKTCKTKKYKKTDFCKSYN